MKLEILSLNGALEFVPTTKTYVIRIEGSLDNFLFFNPLKESDNRIKINNYYFDDVWLKDWKEYPHIDINIEEFEEYFNSEKKKYPKMTKESLIDYFESKGHPHGRCTLFDETIAKNILENFEEFKNETEIVLIHCLYGNNRSPVVGIAMNEIYRWKIGGLKKNFPIIGNLFIIFS